jgi:hypothetical protein
VTLEEAMAKSLAVSMNGGVGSGVGMGVNGGGGNGAGMLVMPVRNGAESVVTGFWAEIAAVRRETGMRGLWKGVGTTM